jgi:hypothetical protein
VFFRYLTFLFRSLEQVLHRPPFQLIPQFTVKTRSITLGKEQIAELMLRLAPRPGLLESLGIDVKLIPSRDDVCAAAAEQRDIKKQTQLSVQCRKRQRVEALEAQLSSVTVKLPDRKRRRLQHSLSIATVQLQTSESRLGTTSVSRTPHGHGTKINKKETTTVSRDQWLHSHRMVATCLFHPPQDAKKNWNGVITTDGVSCSWHQIQPRREQQVCLRKKPAATTQIVSLESLGPTAAHSRPRSYGSSTW